MMLNLEKSGMSESDGGSDHILNVVNEFYNDKANHSRRHITGVIVFES
jgi:hypothetical protein